MHLRVCDRISEQGLGNRVVASGENMPQAKATREMIASATVDAT
jgi:hypothetical protein